MPDSDSILLTLNVSKSKIVIKILLDQDTIALGKMFCHYSFLSHQAFINIKKSYLYD